MRNEEVLKKTEEGMRESNKILIRELIRDLEEKGISPVISIDGEVKKLRLVHESELEDFEKELRKFGFEKSDFCLLEDDKTNWQEGVVELRGAVVVVHKKTCKVKEYKAGNDSHWVADFHHDLENAFF